MSIYLELASPLERKLSKSRETFTRKDILQLVRDFRIKYFTFHYTGIDGKLKELRLPLSSEDDVQRLLTGGERVDGSSLFKGIVDASTSDLYVVPVFKTAFLNPFISGSLDFVCRYFDRNGELADFTPDNLLIKAYHHFREKTGLELWALGELEFYLISEPVGNTYPAASQTAYHQTPPFSKMSDIVAEMLETITAISGRVKYAHAEVGVLESVRSNLPELSGKRAEQFEIEYLPKPIDEIADDLIIGKWLIRNIAFRHQMLASFTPKLEEGVAGNGLHFHMELRREGKNIMQTDAGDLSEDARKLIGGIVHYARSMSVFGNTVASSYLRLVPNQEAPTKICWSDLNRSALIRVPLGWSKASDLASMINPSDQSTSGTIDSRQTVELRSPDGSAWIHTLLAAICFAAEYGLNAPESLQIAENSYVRGNIFENLALLNKLDSLPTSCVEGAEVLQEEMQKYYVGSVFNENLFAYYIKCLQKENDLNMNEDFSDLPADDRLQETRKIMHKDLHRN
jgi:glutamine synthetase